MREASLGIVRGAAGSMNEPKVNIHEFRMRIAQNNAWTEDGFARTKTCVHSEGVLCVHSEGMLCVHSEGVLCVHSEGVLCVHNEDVLCVHSDGPLCVHSEGVLCMHVRWF